MHVKNSRLLLLQWLLLFLVSAVPVIPQMLDPSYSPGIAHILCSAVYYAYCVVASMLFVARYADICLFACGLLTFLTVLLVHAAPSASVTAVLSFFFILPHMGLLRIFAYSDIPLLLFALILTAVPILKFVSKAK